jgi:hypothetical protein
MVSDYALAVEDEQTSGLGTLDMAIMEISAKHLRIWHRRSVGNTTGTHVG